MSNSLPRRLRWTLRALILGCALLLPATGGAQEVAGLVRSDCNGDGPLDISDPVFLLESLFGVGGQTPPCQDACDSNDDGALDIADVITLLQWVFGMSQMPLGSTQCGLDPTPDPLGCANPPCTIPADDVRVFTMETHRAGLPYRGELPRNRRQSIQWDDGSGGGLIQDSVDFAEYGLPAGATLPGDLVLDPVSGVLTGTTIPPGLHRFDLWARCSDGVLSLLELELPAFTAAESIVVPNQQFETGGFSLVAAIEIAFDHIHELPWPFAYPLFGCTGNPPLAPEVTESKTVRIYYPISSTGALPLIVFHHGAGFGHAGYQQLLTGLASQGVVVASVNDQFSFNQVEDHYCWGGHDEAARVLARTRQVVEEIAADPSSPVFGLIDPTKVFFSGHSRGGAAAMIAHELHDRDVRGIIMLQGTDARQDSTIGNTDRWISLPDVPVLSITAEQDTDVLYPYSERVLERFRGPTTMVTIHGGCHGYTSDAGLAGCDPCTWSASPSMVDSCRYITRELQQSITRHYILGFLRRYADGDLSVEGLLYGGEAVGSPYVTVAHRRNLSGERMLADFDDFPLANGGGTITSTGTLLFLKGACYDWPFPIPSPIQGISNLVLIADPNGVTSFRIPVTQQGEPLDAVGGKSLSLRLKNHDIHGVPDNSGYGHLDLQVRLTDGIGRSAAVPLDPLLPQVEFHPETHPVGTVVPLKYQRFTTIEVPLSEFTITNPLLDLSELVELEVEITTFGTATVDVRLGFDDIMIR